MVLALPGESISDTSFDSLHRTTQGYGDKVVPGEGARQLARRPWQGYTVKALSIAFEYRFDILRLDEIYSQTMEANAAMSEIMERKFATSPIAADSPETGRDCDSVGAAPLGMMERYWKLMSDRLEERVQEAAVCYCIERAKWRS